MEKLRFTIRFIVLLVAFPVVMFTELTREDKVTKEQKPATAEKVSEKPSDVALLSYNSPFMQAVYN